jgi:RNA polymerase sigma-70 factor (ECF subfamily)
MEPLERIYLTYRDFVYRICVRYARDADDAEDMTQETFIKISGRLGEFRGDSELGTWIYRVAVNRCLDHLRRRRSEVRHLQTYLDGMVVRNLAPEGDQVLARLTLERILGKLRPMLRQTLFLTLAEGLSYAEAAEVLKISPAAVSKSVNRFLKKGVSPVWRDENPGPGGLQAKASGKPAWDASKRETSGSIHG